MAHKKYISDDSYFYLTQEQMDDLIRCEGIWEVTLAHFIGNYGTPRASYNDIYKDWLQSRGNQLYTVEYSEVCSTDLEKGYQDWEYVLKNVETGRYYKSVIRISPHHNPETGDSKWEEVKRIEEQIIKVKYE
jgi:hypothetical protein